MGAYENVPILQEKTSSAGQAWAEVATTAGVNIAKGIIAREENIRKRKEEENLEGLEEMKNLSTSTADATKWQKKLRALQEGKAGATIVNEKFSNTILEAKIQILNIPKQIKNAKSKEEIQVLEKELAHYQGLMDSSLDYLKMNNTFYGGIAEAVQIAKDGKGTLEGQWDEMDSRNNELIRAARIMQGEGNKGDTFEEIQEDGKRYHLFKWTDGEGKEQELRIDLSNPPEIRYTPKTQDQVDKTIQAMGVLNKIDGQIVASNKYQPGGEDGKPQVSERTVRGKDGTLNKITTKVIDEAQLASDVVNAVTPIFRELSDDQKVSVMKNSLGGLYAVGTDGKHTNTWLTDDLKEMMKKTNLESFVYGQELTSEQRQLSTALFGAKHAYETLQKYKEAIGQTKITPVDTDRGRGYPKIIGVSRTANGKGYMIDYDNKTSGFVIELTPEMQAIFDKGHTVTEEEKTGEGTVLPNPTPKSDNPPNPFLRSYK